jgi:hypothetical protein
MLLGDLFGWASKSCLPLRVRRSDSTNRPAASANVLSALKAVWPNLTDLVARVRRETRGAASIHAHQFAFL